MQRRELLKSVGAGGLVSASVAAIGVSARSTPEQSVDALQTPEARIAQLDALHVLRDGEVVRTVENPGLDDLRRLEASLGTDETLVNSDYDCSTYCYEDCFCDDCWWACSCTACSTCCTGTSSG